jgi:hypothetical protein
LLLFLDQGSGINIPDPQHWLYGCIDIEKECINFSAILEYKNLSVLKTEQQAGGWIHFCMKRLRTLKSSQIFKRKLKNYFFKGQSNDSTLMPIQSGRTVPLSFSRIKNYLCRHWHNPVRGLRVKLLRKTLFLLFAYINCFQTRHQYWAAS